MMCMEHATVAFMLDKQEMVIGIVHAMKMIIFLMLLGTVMTNIIRLRVRPLTLIQIVTMMTTGFGNMREIHDYIFMIGVYLLR